MRWLLVDSGCIYKKGLGIRVPLQVLRLRIPPATRVLSLRSLVPPLRLVLSLGSLVSPLGFWVSGLGSHLWDGSRVSYSCLDTGIKLIVPVERVKFFNFELAILGLFVKKVSVEKLAQAMLEHALQRLKDPLPEEPQKAVYSNDDIIKFSEDCNGSG